MYKVVYNKDDNLWWISDDDMILDDLGGFIDPISPKVIVEVLNGEV